MSGQSDEEERRQRVMVITEFDAGDPEATLHALADEILKYRRAVRLPDAGVPFALIAPGSRWRPKRSIDDTPEVPDVPPPAAWDSEVGGRTEVGFGHASRFNLDSEGSTSRRRR